MIVLSGTVTIAPLRKSTRSVLNLYQTWEEVFQVIYQTREGAFHLISKHGKVRYQTREGVFHRYSNTEKLCIKHEKECFIWYWNIEKWVKNSGIHSTLSQGRVTYELEKHVFKTAKLWQAELSGREKVQDPFQGMSRGILSKILCPHLMRRSNL